MFYGLSKLIWTFIAPLNFLIGLVFLAFVLSFTRFRKISRFALAFSLICFVAIGFTRLADVGLIVLESQYEVPEIKQPPKGIIVFGGGVSVGEFHTNTDWHLNQAGERILTGLALKRRFPSARLLHSGNAITATPSGAQPQDAIKKLTADMLGDAALVEREIHARTTWENAVNVAELIAGNEREGVWLLVTSSWHMHRSMGAMRKVGLSVTAYPTDFLAEKVVFPYTTSTAIEQFLKAEIVTKEVIGTLSYWASGRFAPRQD